MKANKSHVALGALALAAALAFIGSVGLSMTRTAGNTYPVTIVFERAGQLLQEGADVKLRGVLVGKIDKLSVTSKRRALVTLAMDPAQPVPANVTAAIRAKTLFGEKFIALSDPSGGPQGRLGAGDRIDETRTVGPFELEEVLEAAGPVLEAIEPGELGGAIHALAGGLVGNEEAVRRALTDAPSALAALNDSNLDGLLGGLDDSSAAFASAAPDLQASLKDLTVVANMLKAKRSSLESVLADTPSWIDPLTAIMQARYADLVDLSVKGADIVSLVSDHRQAIPYTVSSLKNFTQDWVTNLSVGCFNANEQSIDTLHPSLAGSTCWQIWQAGGELQRAPGDGAYDSGTRPLPNSATQAYRVQVRSLLKLSSGREPSDLSLMLFGAVRDPRGLIPQELL